MHEIEATTHEAENEAEVNNYEAENEVEAVKFGFDLTSLNSIYPQHSLISLVINKHSTQICFFIISKSLLFLNN